MTPKRAVAIKAVGDRRIRNFGRRIEDTKAGLAVKLADYDLLKAEYDALVKRYFELKDQLRRHK